MKRFILLLIVPLLASCTPSPEKDRFISEVLNSPCFLCEGFTEKEFFNSREYFRNGDWFTYIKSGKRIVQYQAEIHGGKNILVSWEVKNGSVTFFVAYTELGGTGQAEAHKYITRVCMERQGTPWRTIKEIEEWLKR